MAINGGLLTDKRNLLEIRMEEGPTQPIIAPGEIVIWHKGAKAGEFNHPTPTVGVISIGGSVIWGGQTFTIGTTGEAENYEVRSVKIRLYRRGIPNTITLYITAADGAGKPTGAILATGTSDGNTLTISTTGEDRTINLTNPVTLTNGSKYCAYYICWDGAIGDDIFIVGNLSGSTYAGGTVISTTDGGTNWTVNAAVDAWFEVIGSKDSFLLNVAGRTKQVFLEDA